MPTKPTEHWYEGACDAIVREGKSLFAYVNEKDLGLTNRECEAVTKRKEFQEVLRVRRNIYYKELANDASLSRAAVKGQLVLTITKLLEKEQFDKAANAIMQLAKFEGWTSDGTNVNVFNDLTAKDLADLRTKFTNKLATESKPN